MPKNKEKFDTHLAKVALDYSSLVLKPAVSFNLVELFSKEKREKRKRKHEEDKAKLLAELQKSGVDLEAFEIHLTNEMNRRLKSRYGTLFFIFTFLFTSASYTIVVLNSVFNWNISQVAITSLIIETPIQFVGILLIIANNLFPKRKSDL